MIREFGERPVIVIGGRGLVASHLLKRLSAGDFHGHIVSRANISHGRFAALPTEVTNSPDWQAPEGAVILALLPIWALPPWLDKCRLAAQVIAISSTSLFGKARSPDPYEQDVVDSLGRGEAALREFSRATGVPHTILRPTLIYDGVQDRNVTAIADMIRRFGFFVVAGRASGLRQPIHADDVALCVLASIGNARAYNRSFNTTGCAPIPYRLMVRRVAEALGKPPVVLSLPGWLLKLAMFAARSAKLTKMSPVLFDRMNEDLAFDDEGAAEVLGVHPRAFFPTF